MYIETFKYPNFGIQYIEKYRSQSSKQGLKNLERTRNWRFLRNTYHQEPIKWSLHLPYKPLESTFSRADL